MNNNTFNYLLPKTLLIFLIIKIHLANSEGFYGTCNASFSCGSISGFQYPFRRHQDPVQCGYPGLELNCDQPNIATINIMNIGYRVLGVDPTTQIMKLVRGDMINSVCPQDLVNTTIDHELFDYTSSYTNITFLFECPIPFELLGMIGTLLCGSNEASRVFLFPGALGPGTCETSVIVPFPLGVMGSMGLILALQDGFEVKWKVESGPCTDCTQSGGLCVYDATRAATRCACPGSPLLADSCSNVNNKTNVSLSPPSSPSSPGSSKTNYLNIALPVIGAVIIGVGIGWAIFVCRQRRKRRVIIKEASPAQTESKAILTKFSSKQLASDDSNSTSSIPPYPSPRTTETSKEFGKSSYFGAQVFTYEELEIATDNFNDSRELGDGGFGTVYYGKLLDGREVAVKRLYENNFKRVEQFVNEVRILTGLEHENLMKLYGCTSKRSRELLIVYEYIPNGTVADHLHGKLANSSSSLFSWPVRFNIAIQAATALTYLHQSGIIHRDVKTANILLDKSFRVKVADFGLSRLFQNVTHVSTAPQGTPGYVDPEYYQCYQLTDKSDVYSFGVVLIELISSLQAVDTSRHRLDINLSNMAITKIQNHRLDELVDKSIGFETNGMVRRTTALVAELAFRCLQQQRDMRPTMKEVEETLRGIQNDDMNARKPEVVDIVVDDGGLLKGHDTEPTSPDYGITSKLVGNSTKFF
ncbi:LEAF RUST 10 DISEASE-RESISTANCE LOCUS RECEPTOR-LIKE PROTEIN KINASE-like 1.4 [Bidens hawaiensis]|uniref:LEAF RUST 10 DISEASE-RESISTANCE LOCUS RECEPTOR-LIKE PROTEIN KINASE-like 1.4 n=1 Tax=Bidens hawaiensis TaxID=980011 RepID=UPI004049C9D4